MLNATAHFEAGSADCAGMEDGDEDCHREWVKVVDEEGEVGWKWVATLEA